MYHHETMIKLVSDEDVINQLQFANTQKKLHSSFDFKILKYDMIN